jgi:hypothetical protein
MQPTRDASGVERAGEPVKPAGDGEGKAAVPPEREREPGPRAKERKATGTAHPSHEEGTRGSANSGAALNAFLPRRPLTRQEAILCLCAVFAWIILVSAGVAVATKPYIDMISGGDGDAGQATGPAPGAGTASAGTGNETAPVAAAGKPARVPAFELSFRAWRNAEPVASKRPDPTFWQLVKAWFLIVTCYTFSNVAILCCLTSVIGAIGRSAGIDEVHQTAPGRDLRSLCIAAVIRGFFMYIVILSGVLILADQKFNDISIEQYLKLVGVVSILSFSIGYDPHIFLNFFQRVGQWAGGTSAQAEADGGGPASGSSAQAGE